MSKRSNNININININVNKHLKYINLQNIHRAANFVLCDFSLVFFPEDDPLWIETCRDTEFDVI